VNIALTTWNGRISPVLDVARRVLLVDMRGGKVVRQQEEVLPGDGWFRQTARLAELAPDVLICGAISQPMASALAAVPVRVVPFVSGAVEDVLAAWRDGRLPSPALCMPGCRVRMRRRQGRGGAGPGRSGRRHGRSGARAGRESDK
jgi:predicted Fe-Mo cluster-binding NifX family protein